MAAPMKTRIPLYLYAIITHKPYFQHVNKSLLIRCYARSIRRRVEGLMTPEAEREKLLKKGISQERLTDPSKNPYIQYIPTDPVQANIKQLKRTATQNKNSDRNTSNSKDVDETIGSDFWNRSMSMKPKSNKVKRAEEKYQFQRLNDGDKSLGKIVLSTKSKLDREEKKVILLEGLRLIVDALKAGATMKQLYFTDVNLLSAIPSEYLTAPLYKISYKMLKIWSDTQSPSGLLAIFVKPEQGETTSNVEGRLPIRMICDQVRDPGNMGTLIRTAAAVGCSSVLTVKGCVDVWEPKVIRAGMGCHFHVPLLTNLTWDKISNYLTPSTQILVADTRPLGKIERGLDKSKAELFMDLSEESTSHIEMDQDEGEMTKSMRKLYKKAPLPITNYHQLQVKSDIALIMGGETEGVSPEAKKMAFDHYGQIVTIPMLSVVNSLNTSSAASVILYELKRQIDMNKSKSNQASSESQV